MFSDAVFSVEEIRRGVNTLNSGKTPGYDEVTKEHLKYAGVPMYRVLSILYNAILQTEYIPINFRRGVQVPLYKGKNASILDVNNYRGITLLTTFNKLFEVIFWKRLEQWWLDSEVVSQLQGACRKGVSCVHSAYILQETIATLLKANQKVFVTYLDVSKAFDGVWVEGLFFRLRELGVLGKTWRLLYQTYVDFKCRVRIQNQMSEWYSINCGIHQGGYLSLILYTAFINSLIFELESSRLCCVIHGINVSPLGYADDIATASTTKFNTDQTLRIVYRHSCKWRYSFNPKKSAILVYGEGEREYRRNTQYRYYRLGEDRIKEEVDYDHLGLKNNCLGQNTNRIKEKLSKGRKALNAASGLGLKSGGLTIRACGKLFWAMVVPIITFASELWVLSDEDIRLIEEFQRYAGRRIQRFPQGSPNETSYTGLGWIRLEFFIYVKKLLFIRSVSILNNESIYKRVFTQCMADYNNNIDACRINEFKSPTFYMLRVAEIFGLYDKVVEMIQGTKFYDKKQWKDMIWSRAWNIENNDWRIRAILFKNTKLLSATMSTVKQMIWWYVGDLHPNLMHSCETMAKLVCKASQLKCDNYRFKIDHAIRPYCDLCNTHALENAVHVVMHCQALAEERNRMYIQFRNLERYYDVRFLSNGNNDFYTIMGKVTDEQDIFIAVQFLKVVAVSVNRMYNLVLKSRDGIG